MTSITVLDGHTLNPGDLSWDPLLALGECTFHEHTPAGLTVERAAGAQIVLTNKVVIDKAVIQQLPALRYIGVTATGTNVVDLAAAREHSITVTNVPGYGTSSVAQLAFALLLELTHRVGDHSISVRSGDWSRSSDFCYWNSPLVELDGLTLGLIGYGEISRHVATIARAFGMRILVHTRTPGLDEQGIRFVDLDTLFQESDAVSLHCPLTADTKGIVGRRTLALMKPSAFLINTARGPLVDEAALADALNDGRIAGAGLDVLSAEPPPVDNPLLQARNCIITPHFAWATKAARERLLAISVANIRSFLAGTAQNVVS